MWRALRSSGAAIMPSVMCFDKVQICNLGLTSYRDVWAVQKQRRIDVSQGVAQEIIFLTEHKPVYTLGRHGHVENMLLLPPEAECVRIERGGDITCHAPGQIVAYPIIDLWERKLGVKDYVHMLEQWVIHTVAEFGIAGERDPDAPGVWVDPGTAACRKICALGVAVSRGVTMHGFALNVANDLRFFRNINPCGFTDRGVTSVSLESGVEVSVEKVAESLLRHNPFRRLERQRKFLAVRKK